MKYIVYITTNKINNKIYIGVHQTENPNVFDGYLGCGAYSNKPSSYNKGKTYLHNVILKYGPNAFHRTTLKVFDKLEDALDLEAWLVTEEFIKRKDTYNLVCGGGAPPKDCKKIYEFDLHGNFIKEWDSIKEITNTYNINKDRIHMCIKDKRSFNNSFWSEENHIDISKYRVSSRGYVYQYNSDGKLLNTFENASQAALQLDIPRDAIVNAVFNRTLCSGCYFLRADEDINKLLYDKSHKLLKNITPVYRYLQDGTFDKEYESIVKAVKDTPKASHGNIIRAIKNNRTCGGYKWSYIKSEKIKPYLELDLKPIKIAQYDLNHNLIKIWDSVKNCKKEFPGCQKVCRKERKTTKGYIFEYVQ